MNDNIDSLMPPHAFTTAQRFLLTLLYDYYETKCDRRREETRRLLDQNSSLQEEIKELRKEMFFLKRVNEDLTSKLRSANNMIRILTKTKENFYECHTPTTLNVLCIDKLFKDSADIKALSSYDDRNDNNKNFKTMKSKPAVNILTKPCIQVKRLNCDNALIPKKSESDELKASNNTAVPQIENKKSCTTSNLSQAKSRLTFKKNIITKTSVTSNKQMKSEESKPVKVQKAKINPKKELQKLSMEKILGKFENREI